MDLLDVIAIDVVREGMASGRKVPAKIVAQALGVSERHACRRLRTMREDGLMPAKKKAKPRVPLTPYEKARRAARQERLRLAKERQAQASVA